MKTHGKAAALAIASSMLSACGGGGGGSVLPTQPAVVQTFTTWRTDLSGKSVQLKGEGKQVAYTYDTLNHNISSVGPTEDASATALFDFDAGGALSQLILASTATSTTTLTFTSSQIAPLSADPDFVIGANSSSRAIVSNPKSLAWDYQSFGVWETGLNADNGSYGAVSLGAPTAGSAIPATGSANFAGKVVGSYVDGNGLGNTVLANLNVGVDWTNRSLNLSTTATRTSADGINFSPNTGLDMSNQTLTYSAGTNGFSGNLTTSSGLSGPSSGSFYGPGAQELGGVFFLRGGSGSVATYSGAYGAKITPP